MPKGLEFHRGWDSKKRKKSVLDNLSESSNDEWESSSCTALALKQRKSSQLDWQSGGGEEVGSEDFRIMGREFFEPTASIRAENNRLNEDGTEGQKDVRVEIQGNKFINHLEKINTEGKEARCDKDDEKVNYEPLTLDGNRNYMLSIITELKETRAKMLIWMRQEMLKIMNEGSGRVVRRTVFGRQAEGNMEFEEQHGSGPNANSTGMTVMGNGNGEIDFGGETSASGGTGFGSQNNFVDGAEYNVQNGTRDLSFGSQNCSEEGQELGYAKEKKKSDRLDSGFGDTPKVGGQADAGMGSRDDSEGRMNLDNQSGGPIGVAMPAHNGSVGMVHLGSQIPRDAAIGLRSPNELQGEVTFGAEQNSCGIGLNYTSQTSGGSGTVFGRQSVDSCIQYGSGARGGVEIRSSVEAETSNTIVNSACNGRMNTIHMPGIERTTDLIGIQNQNLQSSVALNMMWNGVVQDPRDVSQAILPSGVQGIHYNGNNKVVNGGIGSYRGLICSNTPYGNSTGLMNSPGAIRVTSTSGMQPPLNMRNMPNSNPNTLGMQSQMGMQNHAATHNFPGLQNFLGLSMNRNMGPPVLGEGINTHVFPGMYFDDHLQHIQTAKSNTVSGSFSMCGRPHK